MATLARPGTRSFFACGDFNQRVTRWGVRSIDEVLWATPDIESKTISVAYRQSRQLHELALQIVGLDDANMSEIALPSYVENDGVPPVLATNMEDIDHISTWLALRIQEIETFVGELPSIAVLVNSEDEVDQIAESLSHALVNQNIHVIPCRNGQVRGREGAVRVFNVEHIKGLEFEAVFFVGIDQLADRYPDLFDKYLYVGATRAATYLGLTFRSKIPTIMAGLERLFGENWT